MSLLTTFTATAARLTPKCTAFTTLGQLEAALKSGYVPTLSRKHEQQSYLGSYLECRGYRVFWTL